MLTPRFISIMQDTPIDLSLFKKNIQKMCDYLACGKKDGWDVCIACSEHIALAYLALPLENLRTPLIYEDASGLYIAMQVPIGMPSSISKKEMLSGEYLKTLWNILQNTTHSNASIARSITPPQALVALEKEADVLRIFTDWCGSSRVYEQKQKDKHTWTNFAPLLPFITKQALYSSHGGWGAFAGWRTFPAGYTAYEGVPEIRHGAFHYAFGQKKKTDTRPYISEFFDFTTNVTPSLAEYTHISESIYTYIQDVAFCVDAPMTVDLTAGRDSRIIAAHAIAAGVDCTFKTYSPPEVEAAIAKQLLACTERKYEHTITAPQNNAKRRPLFPEVNDIRAYYKQGFKEEPFFNSHLSYGTSKLCARHFSGTCGESVHASQYSEQLLSEPEGAARLFQAVLKSSFASTLIAQHAQDKCRKVAYAYKEAAQKHGITDYYLNDYMLNFIWYNRRYPLNTLQGIFSYTTLYEYTKGGFCMPLQDKLDATFLRQITAQAIPQWRDIPYTHEITVAPEEHPYFYYILFWEDKGIFEEFLNTFRNAQGYKEFYNVDAILQCMATPYPATPQTIHSLLTYHEGGLRLYQHIAHDEFLQELNAAALAEHDNKR